MANIANLAVQLTAHTGTFRRDMIGAISPLNTFANAISGVNGLIAGLGFGLSAVGFVSFVKRQAEAIDELGKTSDRLNISTEALAAYQRGAKLSGIETEAFTGSLEKFNRLIGLAAMGSTDAQKSFAHLRLDAADLIQMPLDEAIAIVADRLNALQTSAERAAVAQEIFGRGGQTMLSFLAEGSEGLAKFKEEAQQMGLAFSRIDSRMVETALDRLEDMSSLLGVIGGQIAIEVSPLVTHLSEKFIEAAKSGEGFGNKIINALEKISIGLSYLGDAWQVLEIIVKVGQANIINLFAGILAATDKVVNGIISAMNKIPGVNIKAAEGLRNLAEEMWREAEDLAEEVKKKFEEPWKHDSVREWWRKLREESEKTAAASLESGNQIANVLERQARASRDIGGFKQVEASQIFAMARGGLSGTGRLGAQTVRDPQVAESNRILSRIEINTRETAAVAV